VRGRHAASPTDDRPRRTRRPRRRRVPVVLLAPLAAALVVVGIGPASSAPVAGYRPVEPQRVLAGTDLAADRTTTVALPQVPAGARSATLQLTASRTTARSTAVSVCPGTTASAACRAHPGLVVPAGEPGSVVVTVPVTPQQTSVTIHADGPARVFADLHGFGVVATTARDALYVPVEPRRVVDGAAVAGRGATGVRLPDVPAGATAVALRVTTRNSSSDSYLSVCPAQQDASRCAATSVLNQLPGRTRQTSAVVRLDTSSPARLQLFNLRGDHRVDIDVDGWFVSRSVEPEGGSYRVLDAPVTLGSVVVGSGRSVTLRVPDVPRGTSAVALDLTGTGAWRATNVSACPGTAASAACGRTSFLTASPEAPARNLALVPLGGPRRDTITLTSSDASVRIQPRVVGHVVGGPAVLAPAPSPAPTRTATPTPSPTRSVAPTPRATPTPSASPTPTPTRAATPSPTSAAARPTPAPSAAPARPGGRPGPSNTGVPSGTKLTVHEGDLTVTTPGAVIDSLDIRGFVKIAAPDVTIRRSVIRGYATNEQRSLVSSTVQGASVVVEDSELYAQSPSAHIDGVRGQNITVRRSNIHHVIDSFHLTGGNVTIEASWLHDNLHYENDPLQGGEPSHDDSIQIQAGSGFRIIGNTIEGATNSGIQLTQDRGPVSDLHIVGNWADGGGCTVNFAEKGKGPFLGVVITDNVFGRQTSVGNCAIIAPPTTSAHMTVARNVYDDGAAVSVRRGS